MRIVRTRTELQSILGTTAPGFVPTLGALHAGHQVLIARSAAENPLTVVSIFLNPTQFTDPADFARYPRDLERDAALAAAVGADLVYAPDVAEVYPPGAATTVAVADLGERWEGAARPGHFQGVATVVTILLNSVRPARAYFGEKDFQQLTIIRRLHADLALPGEIVACPTVREPDGLALSSRNARLSPTARSTAPVIPRTLTTMATAAAAGERDSARLIAAGQVMLAREPKLVLDYLAIVDSARLEPVSMTTPGARIIVAARLEDVRLIDNVAIEPDAVATTRSTQE